ncbi:hypothetical protein Ddye_016530 [Dipteronia dyeriana]|uniref:Pentatricopeptide repeat-containing protein n=1 Tax=Dipteronia dyeriana TaxID=168575 RepID=A0AAD9U7K5_9ROSI|nr:hypothetical protein Ddye_016530 [Dipteronia dyeriana]
MQKLITRRLQNYTKKQSNALLIHSISTCIPVRTNDESWTTLISLLAQGGPDSEFALFEASKILDSGFKPNCYALVNILRASTDLGFNSYCQQLHTYILKSGEALRLFLELERSEAYPDAYSFTAALAACGQLASARNDDLEQAFRFFHQLPDPDTISYNELINSIAQFGNMKEAIEILFIMPKPNSSSWNSILTGYVHRNRAPEALEFFYNMKSDDVEMDEYTFSITLSGIASLAALTWGMLIHCCTIKQGLNTSIVVASALIDMYSKCGQLKDAELMFRSLSKKNLITWNAMITGYAHNGDSTKVIQLFEQLKLVRDLKPDWVTFLNVLAACLHNEIPLHQAIQFFESMIKDYGIEPTVEHCCSSVRLMGQNGEVCRAIWTIYQLDFTSYVVVWRALLGACVACGKFKVANISAAKVIRLEGGDDYVYVTMSNIFAGHGKWGEVSAVRKFMQERGVTKEAGCSWIEVEN